MKLMIIVVPLLVQPVGGLDTALYEGMETTEPSMGWLTIADKTPPTVNITGISDVPVFLNLQPPAPDIRFVRVYPLPEAFAMSHGFRTNDAWFVALRDIGSVELLAPAGFTGTLQLKVRYYREDRREAALDQVLLVEFRDLSKSGQRDVAPFRAPESPTAAIAPQAPQRPPARAISQAQELASLDQAQGLLRAGDISSARLLFEDLAIRGSSRGARALAETYDPDYLRRTFIAGLQPNIELAKKWYRRAAELGDNEASSRVTALGR
jgi:hypothetical protein